MADPDPVPRWVPTPSSYSTVTDLRSDLALQISDDALTQMLSALTATGELRTDFSGYTLSDIAAFVPESLLDRLAALGIGPPPPPRHRAWTWFPGPLAQDPNGESIPPILALIDTDGAQNGVDFAVRTQLAVRIVDRRGTASVDDRDLCSCADPRPDCLIQPCLVTEQVLKLNLLGTLTLDTPSPVSASIGFQVREVQVLERREGFHSFEATDQSQIEDEVVATSADSPLLELLRLRLNGNLPTLPVPASALTLEGAVTPTEIRLFATAVEGSGFGLQDYLGLAVDVLDTTPARRPLGIEADVIADSRSGVLGAHDSLPERAAITHGPNPFLGIRSIPDPSGDRCHR